MIWFIALLVWIVIKLKLAQRRQIIRARYETRHQHTIES
jgi:hypothetical protein